MSLNKFASAALLSVVAIAGCTDDKADAPPPGPGAALKCTSSGKNAFDTYGAAGFVAFLNAEIDGVAAEYAANGTANLGPSFQPITSNPDRLKLFRGNLAAFLLYVYGGPATLENFEGGDFVGPQDMVAVHTGLKITQAQYDYFLTKTIVPALVKIGVPEADINSCFAPPLVDPAFVASIINK